MPLPCLRLFDGFHHTSPQLRDQVRDLQVALRRFDRAVVIDGRFDRGTEQALRAFQRARGLPADGATGLETWAALGMAPAADADGDMAALDEGALGCDLVAAAAHGALIERIAAAHGLLPAILAGLGSRLSRWGLALEPRSPGGTADRLPRPYPTPHRAGALPPDGLGFGRGLMLLDYDEEPLARDGGWQDPARNLEAACRKLGEARQLLRRRTVLHGEALLRGVLAAYGCGSGHVLRAVRQGLDLDFYTPGRSFGRDILRRAGVFRAHGWD